MKHIGLFEGIGGFSLAARWMGWETIAWCEWNQFCQKVLNYHFPKAKQHGDITTTDFSIYRGQCDIVTGGFPCQPYSLAGKRLGKEDERHLWPHMLRAIREIKPYWVVGENVPGLINWNGGVVFNEVQTDLENEGYEVIPFVLPACGVDAPHKRDRVWFIAYSKDKGVIGRNWKSGNDGVVCKGGTIYSGDSDSNDGSKIEGSIENTLQDGWGSEQREEESEKRGQWNAGTGDNEWLQTNDGEVGTVTNSTKSGPASVCESKISTNKFEFITNTSGKRFQGATRKFIQGDKHGFAGSSWRYFPTQSPICNGNDGLSDRLDGITFSKWRNESIKAGGNSIVPQVALQIFKAIKEFNELTYGTT